MPEPIDFQPYLDSICTKYNKWNRIYTPTDAEHERSRDGSSPALSINLPSAGDPLVLFEQMAEIVRPPKKDGEQDARQQEAREAPREKIGVLQGLREFAKERVLLVGRPGLGKSTTLQRFLWEEAQTARASQHPQWIPILVELRYCQGSPFDRLRASLQQHDRDLQLSDGDLERELGRGRFLLLFDGLNELPSEEARQEIQRFCHDYRGCPLVGTTRDLSLGGSFGIEKQMEMLHLDDRQMQQFVRAYLPEQAEAMLRALAGRSRSVGQTRFEHAPLLLMMLCGVFRQTGEIPANLGLLFRGFAKLHREKLKEDVPVSDRSRDWWQPLLVHLGEYMMRADKPTEFRVAIPKTEVREEFERWLQGRVDAPGDRAAECLEDLLEHSLLQVQAGENIEFLHQLIQEYYAAEALLLRLRDLSDGELKREYLNYLKWTEPLALMLALVGDEAQAVRVVRLALEVDWMLGARLAGEVKREFQERTVGMVSGLDVPQWLKVELWGRTRSDFAVPGLVGAIEDKYFFVRERAVVALGKLGSQEAIPGLLQTLEDENFFVRASTVEALGKQGSQEAIPGLLQMLEDENSFVRRRVVVALGNLGSQEAIPSLLPMLADESSDVRGIAVEVLGNLGSQEAIPSLLQMLADENSDVRGIAVEVLGNLGSQEAIPGLLQALEDEKFFVRERAVEALGKLGSQEAIAGLLQMLEDENFSVHQRAVEALGNLGAEAAIPTLIQALKDQDCSVRARALEALGKLGTKATIPTLIQALEDKHFSVRQRAVEALGNLGAEKAIPVLFQMLKDENFFVRARALEALGKLGAKKAIPTLIQALEDREFFVRGIAVVALGNLGAEKAIPGLLQILEDENCFVRWNAVEALGNLGAEEAIPRLLQMLEDENSFVRWRAAEALGKLGSQKAIPGLLQVLEDKDFFVRGIAVEALRTLGSEVAIPGLLQALEHQDHSVRESALEALGNLGAETTIPEMLQMLEDKESSVRWRAVEALGKLSAEATMPGLFQMLEHKDYYVRGSVLEALGNIKDDRAAHILPNLLILIPARSGQHAFRALTAIQANCKFYNYDIFRSPPIQEPSPNSSQPSTVYNIHNPEAVTIVEQNHGEVIAKQISKAE
jgi:HEAT repeat protein